MERNRQRKTHPDIPAEYEKEPGYKRPPADPLQADRIAQHSSDYEIAFSMVHNAGDPGQEHLLDFSSLSTTYMDDYATMLMQGDMASDLNSSITSEATGTIISKCVNIVANLWNSPELTPDKTGAPTSGGTEAALLAGISAWLNWRDRRKRQGNDFSSPNLVASGFHNAAWERFASLWQIEMRTAPAGFGSPVPDTTAVEGLCDENTIMVVATLGSVFTGLNDNTEAIDRAVGEVCKKNGYEIPIHVDAAIGGLVEPFIRPGNKWDFRLGRVTSISTSAHKYGLVYPSLGWVVWRDGSLLHPSLRPSGSFPDIAGSFPFLNISRPSMQVTGQFYQFIRQGSEGYRSIHTRSMEVAEHVAERLSQMKFFEVMSRKPDNPIIVFTLSSAHTQRWTLRDLQSGLKQYGWSVAVYDLPGQSKRCTVMRIAIRQGVGFEMADMLLNDIETVAAGFGKL